MFYFADFYGKKVLKSTLLKDYDCFFTTKDFILTSGALENLTESANNNREFLKNHLNCNDIITAKQVHGDNIEIIKADKTYYAGTDSLISDKTAQKFSKKHSLK